MDIQMKRILSKLYRWENDYDGENGGPLYSEKSLTEKERKVLSERGWVPNRIETFSGHVEILEKLHSLKQNPHLSESRIIAAFVTGVGGSYLRGRSALSAWNCVGGETGRAARECDYEWVLNIRQQCAEAGVTIWFKNACSPPFRHDGSWKKSIPISRPAGRKL